MSLSFNSFLTRCCSAAVVGLFATTALAQVVPASLAWKWNQPWTRPRASFASVVRDCQGNPVTYAPIAMDEFLCEQSGPIVRISWWGTSQIPTAPARNFFFRIYAGTFGACAPGGPLWQSCAQASAKLVGQDCQGRRVWYYSATFPNPFTQQAGQRYWLQISETDIAGPVAGPGSPVGGAVDFRWSGRRPLSACPAMQRNAAGVVTQPLLDACDNQPDDLSFRLYSRTFSGTILPIATGRPSVHRICFRDPQTLELLEAFEVSTDDEGSFYGFSELPIGQTVRVYVNGMSGLEHDLGLLTLDNNVEHNLGQINTLIGDVDGDDDVDFSDVARCLANFGRMGAVTP